MIRPTELRVLNWILDNGIQRKITGISLNEINNYVYLDDYVTKRDCYGIDPIELTPEILEKCGLVKELSNDIYERDIYSIQVANNTSLYFDAHKDWMRDNRQVYWYLSHEWNNNHFKNDFWNSPKYLHQLQNLYFALTGEELNTDL